MKTLMSLILAGLMMTTVAFAAEDATKMEMDPAKMTPEQKATMERMVAYTTPNENHKILEQMAGSWETTAKFWMDAKSEPEISTGKSEAKMIMDGRFLEQAFQGVAMGRPFIGRGIYGYDNLKKEFVTIWFDNMATGIMLSRGTYDEASKTLSDKGSMSCPITNEGERKFRTETKFIDPDHYVYRSWMNNEKGEEFLGMEITYNRVK